VGQGSRTLADAQAGYRYAPPIVLLILILKVCCSNMRLTALLAATSVLQAHTGLYPPLLVEACSGTHSASRTTSTCTGTNLTTLQTQHAASSYSDQPDMMQQLRLHDCLAVCCQWRPTSSSAYLGFNQRSTIKD
jgi:hypothetical protein